jgi:NAD(P)H-hydrate repair Nnr-like enzyme with NAD(P)H-hydrate dehydratase domain
MFPTRKKESHKGVVGKVLIVGESEEYDGASILSVLGAEFWC